MLNKKIIILIIFILGIFVVVYALSPFNLLSPTLNSIGIECRYNKDCTLNECINNAKPDSGMTFCQAHTPTCFRFKCGSAQNQAYGALEIDNFLNEKNKIWQNSFKICDKIIGNINEEECKIEVCENLTFSKLFRELGENGKVNYSSKQKILQKECMGEAVKNSSCSDGKRNGLESDIDCGGPNCEQCEIGNKCQEDEDCVTLACNQNFSNGVESGCVKNCSNGYILDNTPCKCGNSGIRTKEAYDEYFKKNGLYPSGLYCCNNKRQNEPCNLK